jgi:defect in organelle trafficking protein DotD
MATRLPKYTAGLAVLACLTGCATPKVPTDVESTGMPNAELALERAIDKVNGDMAQIGAMRLDRAAPAAAGPMTTAAIPDELRKPVDFIWAGPLDDGVRKLAASIGYQVAVIGPGHAQPIPISINTVGTVLSAFHALGDQAGSAATVSIDTVHHQVQVIHHV